MESFADIRKIIAIGSLALQATIATTPWSKDRLN
jgi:hypothetical protein